MIQATTTLERRTNKLFPRRFLLSRKDTFQVKMKMFFRSLQAMIVNTGIFSFPCSEKGPSNASKCGKACSGSSVIGYWKPKKSYTI